MPIPIRKINLAITLAQNTGTSQPPNFSGTDSNTVKVTGLRTSVQITNSGSFVCSAQVRVYGLSDTLMNELSTLGMALNIIRKNTLLIEAGDDQSGMSTVFLGTIQQAYADYSSQPDVPFHFECIPLLAESVIPAAPSSFNGSTSVVSIMQGLARQIGYGFRNNGVDVKLSSPYFSGSPVDQIKACVEHANIEWGIFVQVLEIWPKGGSRESTNVPTISPETGLIGYPAFTQQGIVVNSIFRPDIAFGAPIKVNSSLLSGIKGVNPAANFPTNWTVYKVDLALDAEMPGGEWRSTAYCYNRPTSGTSNVPIIPPPR